MSLVTLRCISIMIQVENATVLFLWMVKLSQTEVCVIRYVAPVGGNQGI